jgi:hypothetical protein
MTYLETINRVPVVGKDGCPLMPCEFGRAKELIDSGDAVGLWSKLGIAYIRLQHDTPEKYNTDQRVTLATDPGSKYDGYAVTTDVVNLTAMVELPLKPVRARFCRHKRLAKRSKEERRRIKERNMKREQWFNTSVHKDKLDFRLMIVDELHKLFPITDFAIEAVWFNKNKVGYRRQFHAIDVSMDMLYRELEGMGRLHLYDGYQTKSAREILGLRKHHRKSMRVPESHAVDAVALAHLTSEVEVVSLYPFYVWGSDQLPLISAQEPVTGFGSEFVVVGSRL